MGLLTGYYVTTSIEQIIVVTALIHNTLVFIYHFTKIINKKGRIQLVSFISMLTMIFFLIAVFFNCIIHFHKLFPSTNKYSNHCEWIIIINVILWVTAKTSMYWLFLERIFNVFQNTELQFNKKHIKLSKLSLLCYYLFLCIMSMFFGGGKLNTQSDGLCDTDFPFWMNGVAAFGDIIICSLISTLFSRRLLFTNLTVSETATQTITNYLMNDTLEVVSRSTVLTFIALITTELSLLLCGIMGIESAWISIDFMVNSWCVLLMFSVQKNLFKFLCGHCQSTISIKCLTFCSCDCIWSIETELIKRKENKIKHKQNQQPKLENRVNSSSVAVTV